MLTHSMIRPLIWGLEDICGWCMLIPSSWCNALPIRGLDHSWMVPLSWTTTPALSGPWLKYRTANWGRDGLDCLFPGHINNLPVTSLLGTIEPVGGWGGRGSRMPGVGMGEVGCQGVGHQPASFSEGGGDSEVRSNCDTHTHTHCDHNPPPPLAPPTHPLLHFQVRGQPHLSLWKTDLHWQSRLPLSHLCKYNTDSYWDVSYRDASVSFWSNRLGGGNSRSHNPLII